MTNNYQPRTSDIGAEAASIAYGHARATGNFLMDVGTGFGIWAYKNTKAFVQNTFSMSLAPSLLTSSGKLPWSRDKVNSYIGLDLDDAPDKRIRFGGVAGIVSGLAVNGLAVYTIATENPWYLLIPVATNGLSYAIETIGRAKNKLENRLELIVDNSD